jgi:hypothetical protein
MGLRSNIPSAPAQTILAGVTSTAGEINYNDITAAGTVEATKAVVVDGNKDASAFRNLGAVNIDAGSSGAAGTVDIFPSTASKGKIAITAANSAGDTTTTIVNASQGGARTYTIPDAGGAASFAMTGTTAGSITATVAELNKLDASVADVYADGLTQPRVAQATWDFAVDGGAVSAIDLGVTIPANSIIIGGIVDVQTTCTTAAADTGTGAISVEGADDIVAAVAVETGTPWDQGLQQVIPATAANAVKTTTAKAITFTIAVQAFTAGKFTVSLFYIPTLVNV